ncbi:MAG: ATP-binding cassette domain-containing protein [Myxococcaceae bacterium]
MSPIEVEQLGKRFGERIAVEAVTFSVSSGEVFGLLGPNGAGKTTTVRMLAGLLRPSSGRARVAGHWVSEERNDLRCRVGFLPEQPGLYDRLTAEENLRFFMRLYEVDERVVWPLAQSLLTRFGLSGRESEPTGRYSKGMRQKLALVRALIHSPQVIFLDEPTSGLDPESARVVRDVIAELATEGRAVVLCSHNLGEVERLCHRIGIVKGHLRALGTVSELRGGEPGVEVELDGDASPFRETLRALPALSVNGSKLFLTLRAPEHIPDVVALLTRAGARIVRVQPRQRSLEDLYLEAVSDGPEAPP